MRGEEEATFVEGLGKYHTFRKSDLPRPITAKTGDVIIVVEEFLPDDITSIKTRSDTEEVKVRVAVWDGEVNIIITGDKATEAKVSWSYEKANGDTVTTKDVPIKIE